MTKKEKIDKRDHRGRTNSIINNNWNQVEIDTREIKFNLSALLEPYSIEDEIHEKMLIENTHKLINEYFPKHNKILESQRKNGETSYRVKLLNKKEINEAFKLFTEKSEFTNLEILSQLTFYFSMDTFKFFNALSNLYKNDILIELYEEKTSKILNKDTQLF